MKKLNLTTAQKWLIGCFTCILVYFILTENAWQSLVNGFLEGYNRAKVNR
ncbi:MAG: hypothetical protein Q3983_09530 [Capnocytophaga sp.]|nr:hypothetical protein [Capnocytophaga sp.]